MKVGSPITYAGRTGTVTAIHGHVAHCLTADGKRFRAPYGHRGTYRKRAPRPCEVRMPGVFDWLKAEYINRKAVRIVADHPVWKGRTIVRAAVEVRNACKT